MEIQDAHLKLVGVSREDISLLHHLIDSMVLPDLEDEQHVEIENSVYNKPHKTYTVTLAINWKIVSKERNHQEKYTSYLSFDVLSRIIELIYKYQLPVDECKTIIPASIEYAEKIFKNEAKKKLKMPIRKLIKF